ncbi:hypothetical protein Nepgr_033779 [Nepenthes gracilis]|uniref:NB-ARC domain-containing protein n=1 Tax=Nepenthes gracilis TaxID=150966 RepID=A0AAD3Y8M2_NEPGR|nr:hypothetical protein Nepgr_033779 [Nepenthes gracilis]
MDAVASVLKNCLVWAFAQIKKELSYICHYKDNINDLRKKHDELETLKLQIEGEVEAGERRRETIGPSTKDWHEEAEVCLADGKSGFMDENRIRQKDQCCFGLVHMNLKYRYLMSKKAAKKFESIEKITKKMQDGGLRAITLLGEPPKLGSMPTAYSKSLASRESTLNEIMEALKDKKVHRIGIYGMGGIGKTTLIEEVAKRRAEVEGLFKVVIAEVSQAPDILKMQQQIAERIGLSLQGLKSEGERARAIYEALKKLNHKEEDKRPKQQNLKEKDNRKEEKEDNQMSKKRTTQALVILDNMWKKLDLDKVGIPHDCKIALTTRSEDVCREMEANKKFGLQGLNDTEATELFLEKCGYKSSADHDDGYKSVMDELVKKCGGLPLAIVALANTLRDRNLSDWKHVADQLGKTVSARVGGPMEDNVHPILKWSYNSISNKEKKKFFLLCCLFPLGLSIAIQDLMRYGAGLGLFQYMNSLGEAIEQAHSWATELKSSSLLLEADNEQNVRIHDIVREALLSIAVKGENIFHVGTFPGWLLKETFRTYTAISMTSKDNHESLSGFKFPKLEMLLLKSSKPSELRITSFKG